MKREINISLTPTPITDKNGKQTTVHKNTEKGVSGITAARVAGAALPTNSAPKTEDYEFESQLIDFHSQDFMDVRDITQAFSDYATELEDFINEYKLKDDSKFTFEELDESAEFFDSFKKECVAWAKNSDNLTYPANLEDMAPENEFVRDWVEYAQEISNRYKKISDESSSILTKDSYMPERAEEQARNVGDLPRSLPSYIADNINWDYIADQAREDSKFINIEGSKFYLY